MAAVYDLPVESLARRAEAGVLPDADEAHALADLAAGELAPLAARLRDAGFGGIVTFSPKVFLPVTHLCRDVCHYCAFARTPRHVASAYMSVEAAVAEARRAAHLGCREALLTLGERPERRYRAAREALAELGADSTLEHVARIADAVRRETGLLPHINPGCMSAEEIAMLQPVAASMGIMLESASERLCAKGMPHHGSPDKHPEARLETVRLAGEASVPLTSGILVGIGETRAERIDALLALRELHRRHGHIQELIVQNFRAKPGTLMANAPEPGPDELVWSLAAARLMFGPEMSIQAPPNLSPGGLQRLVAAGINDWGGVSPATPDYVNPEAPWPQLDELADRTRAAGKRLEPRLTVYPAYARDPERWLDRRVRGDVLKAMNAHGLAREGAWTPGAGEAPAAAERATMNGGGEGVSEAVRRIVARARAGERLSEDEIVRLFGARGDDLGYVRRAADELRAEVCGETVTYVVNRNINYTNVCTFGCRFCAFSKGRRNAGLRGRPYDVPLEEVERRTREAWRRGATEVCLQGGIHPDYTGRTYLDLLGAVKRAVPDIHVHAFTPLEVRQGASTLGLSLEAYLTRLRDAGLASLPGTAAEILDDEVRAVICPDKLDTAEWLEVMRTAHGVGLRSTSTIMFGHVDTPRHWARHLLRLRDLQADTGGFTELVPLPFVAAEAPIYLRGRARCGPTYREAVLMHAVARLALHPLISAIQASWVKMGETGVADCLAAGASDLGGTLMNESITRAAGARHGQEWPPERMDALIADRGRIPRQRTTLYGAPPPERISASYGAPPLADTVEPPPRRRRRDRA